MASTPTVAGVETPRGRVAPGPVERVVGWLILGVLVAIAAGVWVVQDRPNPALAGVASPDAAPAADAGFLAVEVAGLTALGPVESFNGETVSEKIDGKAELYLEAGFAALQARRYAMAANADAWFEVFLYEMKDARAAYGVYTAQRRPDAQPLAGIGDGYVSGNGLFFIGGRYYAEIIAVDVATVAAAQSFAAGLAARLPAEAAALTERELFPPELLVPESFNLIAQNAFGFDGLHAVMTARLRVGGRELTAFVSKRATAGEAAQTAAAYHAFLLANGGQPRQALDGVPGAAGADLFGYLDIVFAQGNVVAGIHEADDPAAGWDAVLKLYAHLKGVAP